MSLIPLRSAFSYLQSLSGAWRLVGALAPVAAVAADLQTGDSFLQNVFKVLISIIGTLLCIIGTQYLKNQKDLKKSLEAVIKDREGIVSAIRLSYAGELGVLNSRQSKFSKIVMQVLMKQYKDTSDPEFQRALSELMDGPPKQS